MDKGKEFKDLVKDMMDIFELMEEVFLKHKVKDTAHVFMEPNTGYISFSLSGVNNLTRTSKDKPYKIHYEYDELLEGAEDNV